MKTRIIPTPLMPLLLVLMAALLSSGVSAQEFSVASFRELPNDVSAFINPVRDLNDEDCALLKIIGPADFVFSTPLGIVKRVDETGEIWLYLPRGSRKITLKHADWGVLRDFEFPSRLESHKTYEITLSYPKARPSGSPNGETPTVTIRDTLVVTRVDTLLVRPVKPKVPLELSVLANIGFGGRASYAYGALMLSVMKRHGAYLRVAARPSGTDAPTATCDSYGLIDGQQRYYSGSVAKRLFMITGGPIHRLSDRWAIFEGLGYGETSLDWQLAPSEGGGYARNSYYSKKGLTAEIGIRFRWKALVVSATATTLRGNQWFGSIGVGYRFGKNAGHHHSNAEKTHNLHQ